MILISFFIMTFLTSLTGSVLFAVWKRLSVWLDKHREIWLIDSLLQVVLVFHLVPVVFFCLVFWTGAVYPGEAGGLLAATPLSILVVRGLAFVWLCGFLVEVVRSLSGQRMIRMCRQLSVPAGAESREAVRRVKERLHIKKEVPVFELIGCKYPMITGFWRYSIFIPVGITDEKELEMLLEHEFYHYVRGDLHRKRICTWIARIQWFNPYAKRLFKEVDRWGECLCDYHMCYGSECRYSIKEYFSLVIDYSQGWTESPFYISMHLAETLNGIMERIERMGRMKTKKKTKRAAVLALTACFVLASGITSMAAGLGMGAILRKAYEASMARDYEAVAEETDDLEEFTKDRSECKEIIALDGEMTLNARTLKNYTWTVRAGVVYETELFWATKGDKIGISVTPSPLSSKVAFGLDQPNGVLKGVYGTGPMGHTFTVEYTGIHRAFVENMGTQQITVGVSVSR